MAKLAYLIFLLPLVAFAQREVRTYHDPQKKNLQEIYFVSPDDENKFVGKYLRYYPNGKVMVEGNFDDGIKSGVFIEYHENGTPARKLTYVNGLRHGPVQVYDEEGKPHQKAYYQNDKLADSIQLYFDNGNVRRETFFCERKARGPD